MKKKTFIILFLIISLLGSVVNFYATNMLLSDLCNMYAGIHDFCIFSSIPCFMLALDFVLVALLLVKLYKKDENVKHYALLFLVNSSIGLLFSILSSVFTYQSLFSRYPFKGYTIIMLLIHLFLLVISIYLLVKGKNKECTINRKESLKPILLGLFIYYSFNKLGALLLSSIYIQWNMFNITFPFYLSLSLPYLLVLNILIINIGENQNKIYTRTSYLCIAVLTILLGSYIIFAGINNTEFIKYISISLPLERILLMPINSIFQPLLLLSISIPMYMKTYK